jgi:transaldolase
MPTPTPTGRLRASGQSIWLDNITRELLDRGTLTTYITDLGLTGLTSNPTIYDRAIAGTSAYDGDILACRDRGLSPEDTFFDLAITDLRRAADAFRPIHELTLGVDGFVSLEVSPLLAYDPDATVREARRLHALADRANLFIKIPGTEVGLAAVEEVLFAGVPVNVTLLFSPDQYAACLETYMRAIERRVAAGRPAYVPSVASVFISRWDPAVNDVLPAGLRNTLGLLMGHQAYASYREAMATDRWQRLANAGARPQRLLFASTGVKDPTAPDDLYVAGLTAPNTVNTMPEQTLLAVADHGRMGPSLSPVAPEGGALLAALREAGRDVGSIGRQLQSDGAASFVASWTSLLERITAKRASGTT